LNWKRAFPALTAAGIALIAQAVRIFWRGAPPEQWDRVGIFCNVLLLALCVFGWFWPDLLLGGGAGGGVFANVAVSLIAFPMNTGVFDCPLRQASFWSDLWGRHLLWMIWIVIQLLILTGLGGLLLGQCRLLLGQCRALLGWGRKLAGMLGDTVSKLAGFIQGRDKGMLLAVAVGALVWVVFLRRRLSAGDSILDVCAQFLQYCVVYFFVVLFVYLLPAVVAAARNGMPAFSGGIVLAVAVLIAVAAMSKFLLPPLLGVICFLAVLAAVAFFVYSVVKAARKREERNSGEDGGTGENGEGSLRRQSPAVIRIGDLVFLMIFSSVVPVGALLAMAWASLVKSGSLPEGVALLWALYDKAAEIAEQALAAGGLY